MLRNQSNSGVDAPVETTPWKTLPVGRLVLFGERSLRRAMREYVVHYHAERNHQGKYNILLFPAVTEIRCEKVVECRQRLGGLFALLSWRGRVSWRASLGRWLWGCDLAETNTLLMATTDSELACLLPSIVVRMHGRLDFQ